MHRPSHFDRLSPSYLFPEINRRKEAFLNENPGVELINLGVGDTIHPLPKVVVDALSEAAKDLGTEKGYSGYGKEQGLFELRKKIQERLYPHLSPDDIFISDGAKSDVGRLQNLFGGKITVGLQDPAYPVYLEGSILQGVKNIHPLPCISENNFFPTIPKGIDLLYICNPNNPTGKAFTYEELKSLVDQARKDGFIILYDGAYFSYIQDQSLPKSIYDIPGAEKIAIEVNSFSKMAGFTGVRLGWTVVPKEVTYSCGRSIQDDFFRLGCIVFNGASNIAQRGGVAVFSDEGYEAIQGSIQETMANATLLKRCFEKGGYTVYGGEHAPYLWIHTPGKCSWDVFQTFLEKKHLIVTPGKGYGSSGESFIRISAFCCRNKIQGVIKTSFIP